MACDFQQRSWVFVLLPLPGFLPTRCGIWSGDFQLEVRHQFRRPCRLHVCQSCSLRFLLILLLFRSSARVPRRPKWSGQLPASRASLSALGARSEKGREAKILHAFVAFTLSLSGCPTRRHVTPPNDFAQGRPWRKARQRHFAVVFLYVFGILSGASYL